MVLAATARVEPVVHAQLSAKPPARIVVILIDALRADHLSCYGYVRPTSPSIDSLARDSVLFENAYANANWTKPSVASFFTGLWPTETGAVTLFDNPDDPASGETPLAASARTLAEALAGRGYQTGAFVDNPHIAGRLGFARGFERFEEGGDCDELVARYLAWSAAVGKEPSFAYIHMLEPHAPYAPKDELRERFGAVPDLGIFKLLNLDYARFTGYRDEVNEGRAGLSRGVIDGLVTLYDAEILWADSAVGRLVGELRAKDAYDETLLVVTADHGENFCEHGVLAHPTTTFYEQQLHVPLIVKFPKSWNIRASRISGAVQLMDLTATLSAAGGAAPLGRGRVLTGYAATGAVPDTVIVSEARIGAAMRFGRLKVRSMNQGDEAGIFAIYDLQQDPAEEIDVLAKKPSFAERTTRRLVRWRRFVCASRDANTSSSRPVPAGREDLEKLRALGYLGGAGGS